MSFFNLFFFFSSLTTNSRFCPKRKLFSFPEKTAVCTNRSPKALYFAFNFPHHDYDRYLALEVWTGYKKLTCCGCNSNMLETAKLSVRLRRKEMRSSPIFVSVWDRSDNDAPENNWNKEKRLINEKKLKKWLEKMFFKAKHLNKT